MQGQNGRRGAEGASNWVPHLEMRIRFINRNQWEREGEEERGLNKGNGRHAIGMQVVCPLARYRDFAKISGAAKTTPLSQQFARMREVEPHVTLGAKDIQSTHIHTSTWVEEERSRKWEVQLA